jgi:hypothetical protein
MQFFLELNICDFKVIIPQYFMIGRGCSTNQIRLELCSENFALEATRFLFFGIVILKGAMQPWKGTGSKYLSKYVHSFGNRCKLVTVH